MMHSAHLRGAEQSYSEVHALHQHRAVKRPLGRRRRGQVSARP